MTSSLVTNFEITNSMVQSPGVSAPPNVHLLIVGRPQTSSSGVHMQMDKWAFYVANPAGGVHWVLTEANEIIDDTKFFPNVVPAGNGQITFSVTGRVTSGRVYFLLSTKLWADPSKPEVLGAVTYRVEDAPCPCPKCPDPVVLLCPKPPCDCPCPPTDQMSAYQAGPRPTDCPDAPQKTQGFNGVPDMTVGPWGFDELYPNFADKLEFSILDGYGSSVPQLYTNSTNVDNWSMPVEVQLKQLTPSGTPTGYLPYNGWLGPKTSRAAVLAEMKTLVSSSEWLSNVVIKGGPVKNTTPGPICYVAESLQDGLPSDITRISSPSHFADDAPEDTAFNDYITAVWTAYTPSGLGGGGKELSLQVDPDPGTGGPGPLYAGIVVLDPGQSLGDGSFTFVQKSPPGTRILSIPKPGWRETYMCVGVFAPQTGTGWQSQIKRDVAAGLNRAVLICGEDTCLNNCNFSEFYGTTQPKGNLYAKVVHDAAAMHHVKAGGPCVPAAYGFPYDDRCDISTTLSEPVPNLAKVRIRLPPWGVIPKQVVCIGSCNICGN